jgi:hypothetical protein
MPLTHAPLGGPGRFAPVALAVALAVSGTARAGQTQKPVLLNLTTGAAPVDLGNGNPPAALAPYACGSANPDHFFAVQQLNDVGQVVGRAESFFVQPVDCSSGYASGTSGSGWYLYSNGVMTFPWGANGNFLTNKQGIQYGITWAYVFGLDNDGAIYVAQGYFLTSDFTYFSNARIAADGTITKLADDVSFLSHVTLDGRSIVTATSGGLEIYTRNNKTGQYDGPMVVPVTPPAGNFLGTGGSTWAQSFGESAFLSVKWVNNRLEFLVLANDPAAASSLHSYIFQVVDGAAVMKADLGPDSIATALNEIGWATGELLDSGGFIVSNFIFRPERSKKPFEIFIPPSQAPAWVPGTLGGTPVPFGITNSGFVAISQANTNVDPFGGAPFNTFETIQRAPNGSYTSIGNGSGTIFPSQVVPYNFWYIVGSQQNEQGQIAGGSSRAQAFQFDPVSQEITGGFFDGFDAWIWSHGD